MKSKLILAIFLTITVFIFFSERVFACAPGFSIDIYESNDILTDYYPLVIENNDFKTSADFPILNKKYEVITPGWGSEYLLPVYLSAEGKDLSKNIKDMLFRYYKRLGYQSMPLYRIDNGNDEQDDPSAEKSLDRWLKIRNIYIGLNDVETQESLRENLNICLDQILDRAVEDYEYRKTRFSEKELSNWIKNQDDVFQNCVGKETFTYNNINISKTLNIWQLIIVYLKNLNKKTIPLDNISPQELLKYDQKYQQAAKAYYLNDLLLASKLFRGIVDDKDNPHRQLATLSLGWVYIGIDENNYEADLKAEKRTAESNFIRNLKQTQKYYEKLISDSDYASVKVDAQRYLDFILFRTDPARRLIEAEKALLNPDDEKEFVRQLDDFNRLWYKYFQRVLINQKEEARHKEFNGRISNSQSPFLRFLTEWEKPTAEGVLYSLDNYKSNNNPLWLILALRQSNENQKDFNFIKEAINKIKPDSPFYLTAQYYSLEQLTKNEKNKDEAKTLAEKFIKETYLNNQLSAFNLFSDIREKLSDGPAEAFKYSIRYSLALYDENWDYLSYIPYYTYGNVDMNDSKKNQLLSNRTKIYLSTLNSSELTKFIIDNTSFLKDSLERYLKLTVFDRLFVLGDTRSMDLIAENIIKTDNAMSPTFTRYIAAKTNESKNFEAAKILVDYPEVYSQIAGHIDTYSDDPINILKEINDYRTNWISGFVCLDERYKPDDFNPTQIDKEIADKKPINYLMTIIVDFMTQNPNYSDPELLHKVVDMGHYAACQDSETSNIAKQAFQLLHSRHPNNYWAKQTLYWY